MDHRKQTCAHGRPVSTSAGFSRTPGLSKNEKLFELFIKILKKEGPLDLSGQKIKGYIGRFSKEWQSRILKFGGLGKLLCSDPRFTISHNVVSIADPLKQNTVTPLMQAPLKQDTTPIGNPWKIDPPCKYKKSLSFDNINSNNLKPDEKDFSPLLRTLIMSKNKLRNNHQHASRSEKGNKGKIRLFGKDGHDLSQAERSEKSAPAKDDIGTSLSNVMPRLAAGFSGKDGGLQPKAQDTNESLPSQLPQQLPQASYKKTQVSDTKEKSVDQLPEKLYFPSAYDRTDFDTASFISEFTMSKDQFVSTQEDTILKRSQHEVDVPQAETRVISKSPGPFLKVSPAKRHLVTSGNSRLSINSTCLPITTSKIKGLPMKLSQSEELPLHLSHTTRVPMNSSGLPANLSKPTGLPITMSHRTGLPITVSQTRGPSVHWSHTPGLSMNWPPVTGLSASFLPVEFARNWSPVTVSPMNFTTGYHKSSPPTGLPVSSAELHVKYLPTEFTTTAQQDRDFATNKAHPEFITKMTHPTFANKAHPGVVTKAHPGVVTKAHPGVVTKAHPGVVTKAHPDFATKADPELATNKTHPELATTKDHPASVTEIRPPTTAITECRSLHDLNQSWPPLKDLTQSWPPSQDLTQSWPPSQDLTQSWPPSKDLTQSWPLPNGLTESWTLPNGLTESYPPTGFIQYGSPSTDLTQSYPLSTSLTESWLPTTWLPESPLPTGLTDSLPPNGFALSSSTNGPTESSSPTRHTQTLPQTGLADNSTGLFEPLLQTIFFKDFTLARASQKTSTGLSSSPSWLSVNTPLTSGEAALNSSPESKLTVNSSPASGPVVNSYAPDPAMRSLSVSVPAKRSSSISGHAKRSSSASELLANTSPSPELSVYSTPTSNLLRHVSPTSEISNHLPLTPGLPLNSSSVNLTDLHPYIMNASGVTSPERNDAHKRHARQRLFQSSQPVHNFDQSRSYDPWSTGKVQAICAKCSLPNVIGEINVILADFKDRICALNIPSSFQNCVSTEYSQDRAHTEVMSLNTSLGLNHLSVPDLNHTNTACSSFNRAPGHKHKTHLPVHGKLYQQSATHLRGVEFKTDATRELYNDSEFSAAEIQTYINETVHSEKNFKDVKPRNNTETRVHFSRKLNAMDNQTNTSGTNTEQLALQYILRNMHHIDIGEYKDLIKEHFATKNVVSNLQEKLKAAHDDLDRAKSENANLQKQVESLSDLLEMSGKAENGRAAEVESSEQGKRE